ncbi:glycosyltransferase [Lachnospiraceae bacterium C1.1]|nr:glycosyltransferase [Lachnospiraceae bacterium C1.1]
MKKILFYNWIQFDEKEGKGGGVTIYIKNLIRYIIKRSEWEITFLSSGRAYDLINRKPRIRMTSNIYSKMCSSYEIVNSPVFSSAKLSFSFPKTYLKDESLLVLMKDFIESKGGFDVIHFQNFEGLSASVFRLKEFFPETKFIYSLHNYYLFCPQVMLWRNDRTNCELEHCGKECFECMPKDVYACKVRLNRYVDRKIESGDKSYRGLKVIKKISAYIAEAITERRYFTDSQITYYGKYFRYFEKRNVSFLNKYMDTILAVSDRVKEIAVYKGVTPKKLILSYIGTEVAEKQVESQRKEYDGTVLNVCYLGHMRTMKGFYFLLDAFESMPSWMCAKVGLVIASPNTDKKAFVRINNLRSRFASVSYYDGYSHDDLDKILCNVHLGIVPPLWEDNLPQVAIEMKAKGIAVLASDLGGAKELSSAMEFVFKAGDRKDFYSKLSSLIKNPLILDEYWKNQMKLMTMEEHLKQLDEIYSKKEGKSY